MLQLAQWGTALGVEEAMTEVFADSFDPKSVEPEESAAVRKLLLFCESIGALTKHDLLSVQLVNDWLWIEGLWTRLGPAALRLRERFGEPALYENFEALAAS
ncbi:MAG TPA: hypothetical protein VGG41_21100 [Solirubrobacteraceae bacterium]